MSPGDAHRDIGAFVALGALCLGRRQLGLAKKQQATIT